MPRRARSARAAALAAVAACLCVFALPPAAGAFPSRGPQSMFVFLVEHAHPRAPNCLPDSSNEPTCPRRTASQWQSMLDRELNRYFGQASYGQVSWRVRVVANPNQANGWWPAPHTTDQYAAPENRGSLFLSPISIGRDAGEILLGRALQQGVVTLDDIRSHNRMLVIDNYHRRGGQSRGRGEPITYYPRGQAVPRGGSPTPFITSAAVAAEDRNDTLALRMITHELGHSLGMPDLYGTPCPLAEPGAVGTDTTGLDADCVGPWDRQAYDWLGPGLGLYTRVVGTWLSDSAIQYQPRSFRGTVGLAPLDRPAGGQPLGLHFPDEPFAFVFSRLFGVNGYFKGITVECRRRIGDDVNLPGEGVLVSYLDTTRTDRPQAIARRTRRQTIAQAFLRPGETYANDTTGLELSYRRATADGGCEVAVTRRPIRYARLAPLVNPTAVLNSVRPALGARASRSLFAGAGVTVGGRLPAAQPARSAQRGTRISAVRRARWTRIEFSYANTGSRTLRSGKATVRVTEPYTVAAGCASRGRDLGRVVGRVPIRRLRAGRRARARLRFRARTSGPIGVTVRFRQRGGGRRAPSLASQATVAFQTHRAVRRGSPRPVASRIVVSAPRRCRRPVQLDVSPLFLPSGWRVSVRGADRPLRPGERRSLSIRAQAPAGERAQTVGIPIAILSSSTSALHSEPAPESAPPYRGVEDPELLGGFDLLARVASPGKPPPPFRLPPLPRVAEPKGYPTAVPPEPPFAEPQPPDPSTLELACPTVGSAGKQLTIVGNLMPPHGDVPVLLRYAPPPSGTPVEHTAKTAPDGSFSDTITPDAKGSWSLTASWSGDADSLATQATCAFLVD